MFKLSTIVGSQEALVKLMALKLPVKVSYKLKKLVIKLQPDLKIYDEKRVELLKEYGTENDNHAWTIKPENLVKFQEELGKLLDIDVDLKLGEDKPFDKIKIEDLGAIEIESSVLVSLDWLISE